MVLGRIRNLIVVACLAVVYAGAGALAREVITVPSQSGMLALDPAIERIETGDKVIEIQSAPDVSGNVVSMSLEATGKGPIFRWVVFSLRNVGRERIEYVLALPRRGLIGSGLFWPQLTSPDLVSLKASSGPGASEIQSSGGQAFVFSIEPGQTITYSAQVRGGWPHRLTLWQKDRFNAFSQNVAFSKGLILGIGMLAAIYISSLFFIRRKPIFPAAALIAWSAIAYLCVEFGYLPETITVLSDQPGAMRAAIEGVFALSLLWFLFVFLDLRHTYPVATFGILFGSLLGALLSALIAFSPAVAAGSLRLVIVLSVIAGAGLIGRLARRGFERAYALIPVWSFLILWMIGAGLSISGLVDHQLLALGLNAGVVLELLLLAFAVSQFAFASTLLSSGMDLDGERKSLALKGAEQCVWDLDTERQKFFVGAELDSMLGYPPATFRNLNKDAWLEHMHPDDRNGYLSAIKSVIDQGNRRFTQEFRLKRMDGAYRWFRLRARALSGENDKAQRCIGALSDITTEKRAEQRLMRDSIVDVVTGLPNRTLFLDRLEREIAQTKTVGRSGFAIILIDIDRFKRVNDGLGHTVGDSLLLAIAKRLKQHLRPVDTLARVSGDQFGIIISQSGDLAQIRVLAERMRAAIAKPIKLKPREISLTASIGIAGYDREIANRDEMLRAAEIALHNAKRLGKDKVEVYSKKLTDRRSNRYTLEAELRQALGNGEIEIAYQPIARVSDLRIAGFEALMRWQHPKLGLLLPNEFIDIAEESGIIVEMGHFALREAARMLSQWQAQWEWSEPIFVSVNVSSRQILAHDLVDNVKEIMGQASLAPGTLKLEITESLTMANPEISAQVLSQLKELGAGLSIDDFGTGYSSLSYLPRFPFDTVKIDASFIQNAKYDSTTAIVLHAIARLVHDLDMKVVAEGVETQQDLQLLELYNCEFAQGFYLGQAMSSKAVEAYLGGQAKRWPQVDALKTLQKPAPPAPQPAPPAPVPQPAVVQTSAAPVRNQAPARQQPVPPAAKPAADSARPVPPRPTPPRPAAARKPQTDIVRMAPKPPARAVTRPPAAAVRPAARRLAPAQRAAPGNGSTPPADAAHQAPANAVPPEAPPAPREAPKPDTSVFAPIKPKFESLKDSFRDRVVSGESTRN